jgi:NAD+ diphosphatase
MDHAYAGSLVDRADPKRRDPQWLGARLDDASSLFIQFAGERPAVLFGAGEAMPTILHTAPAFVEPALETSVFLGVIGERAVFGVPLPVDDEGSAAIDVPDSVKFIDLRSLASQGLLPARELGALSQARSMLNWHATHGFCAVCGAPSTLVDGGYRRTCGTCERDHFPRTDPVVIMVAVRGDLCLLGRGYHFPEGTYSALAGFVEPGETIEEAARREIHEESGIEIGRITYHSSQPWPFVSSLMIGLIGEALSSDIVRDEEEIEDARWFTRDEARQMLAGTHPQGFKAPQPLAIAHHLLKTFVDGT